MRSINDLVKSIKCGYKKEHEWTLVAFFKTKGKEVTLLKCNKCGKSKKIVNKKK